VNFPSTSPKKSYRFSTYEILKILRQNWSEVFFQPRFRFSLSFSFCHIILPYEPSLWLYQILIWIRENSLIHSQQVYVVGKISKKTRWSSFQMWRSKTDHNSYWFQSRNQSFEENHKCETDRIYRSLRPTIFKSAFWALLRLL
jgi:hypothetical protein